MVIDFAAGKTRGTVVGTDAYTIAVKGSSRTTTVRVRSVWRVVGGGGGGGGRRRVSKLEMAAAAMLVALTVVLFTICGGGSSVGATVNGRRDEAAGRTVVAERVIDAVGKVDVDAVGEVELPMGNTCNTVLLLLLLLSSATAETMRLRMVRGRTRILVLDACCWLPVPLGEDDGLNRNPNLRYRRDIYGQVGCFADLFV